MGEDDTHKPALNSAMAIGAQVRDACWTAAQMVAHHIFLRGYCWREGFRRIGFGDCRGTVLPARRLHGEETATATAP